MVFPDTEEAVKDLTEEIGDKRRLNPYFLKFLKELESQMTSLPRAEYVLGYPLSAPQRKPGAARAAFVAMPYGPSWFKLVCTTIVATASSLASRRKSRRISRCQARSETKYG